MHHYDVAFMGAVQRTDMLRAISGVAKEENSAGNGAATLLTDSPALYKASASR